MKSHRKIDNIVQKVPKKTNALIYSYVDDYDHLKKKATPATNAPTTSPTTTTPTHRVLDINNVKSAVDLWMTNASRVINA